MKPLEKLGISPYPWSMQKGDGYTVYAKESSRGNYSGVIMLDDTDSYSSVEAVDEAKANGLIVSAAPNMYKELYSIRVFLEWCANDERKEVAEKAKIKLEEVNSILNMAGG